MEIGTDISIQTCRDEGYTTMTYDGREKFTSESDCTFYLTLPKYIRDEIGFKVTSKIKHIVGFFNYTDLWEFYTENKKEFDLFAGTVSEFTETPTPYDCLYLADTMNSYNGFLNEQMPYDATTP